MKKKSPGPPPIYEERLKITVAREYLTGGLSQNELARKYDLKNRDAVKHIVFWYRKHYGEGKLPSVDNKPVNAPVTPAEPSSGDKDRQLKEALLKVEALELLLANAKKELGIDLLKKSGTKPPNK